MCINKFKPTSNYNHLLYGTLKKLGRLIAYAKPHPHTMYVGTYIMYVIQEHIRSLGLCTLRFHSINSRTINI